MITVAKHGLKIYNLKFDKPPAGVVYVGRPTTFGNPYTHLKSDTRAIHVVGTREECIAAFREYLLRNTLIADLARKQLRGKSLSCWCAPEACHAQVLMDLANAPLADSPGKPARVDEAGVSGKSSVPSGAKKKGKEKKR